MDKCSIHPLKGEIIIPQEIGGELICKFLDYSNQKKKYCKVQFNYKTKENKIFRIGEASYFEKKWTRNDQIRKYRNWLILETGSNFQDKVYIADSIRQNWKAYYFQPSKEEIFEIYKKSNYDKIFESSLKSTSILKFENGVIEVIYNYYTDSKNNGKTENLILIYEIETKTGVPILKKVKFNQ
jgi:hypothetical protein